MDLNKRFNIQALKRDGETVIDFLDNTKLIWGIGGAVLIGVNKSNLIAAVDSKIIQTINKPLDTINNPLSVFGVHIPKWFAYGVPIVVITGYALCKFLENEENNEKYADLIAKLTLVGGLGLMYIVCFKL